MAKNQSRTPGRDVRGGKGRGARPQAGRPGAPKGKGPRGEKFPRGERPRGSRGASASRGPARGGRDQRDRSDLIEGRRAVEEALACGMPLRSALVQERSGERDQALERIAARLEEAGVAVERVPRARLDALSSHGAHQGVVVRARPFAYAELSDVIAAAGSGDALVVVLDHVTDQGNFGAIVRTAEVVGAAGVVVAKARAASVGVGAYKTSAGAVLHLPIAQVPNLARALEELKAAGFWACAATEHAETDVWHAPFAGRLALVMGSEGEGVSRLVAETCDFSCRLPQRGRVESLNVAQATTVLCYEWLRRVELGEDGADGR
ncbi:23S rRNA (guanosine(2251)-2'-O)-methyltransferase RlmB [Thermophilibacter sp.]